MKVSHWHTHTRSTIHKAEMSSVCTGYIDCGLYTCTHARKHAHTQVYMFTVSVHAGLSCRLTSLCLPRAARAFPLWIYAFSDFGSTCQEHVSECGTASSMGHMHTHKYVHTSHTLNAWCSPSTLGCSHWWPFRAWTDGSKPTPDRIHEAQFTVLICNYCLNALLAIALIQLK